MRSVFFRSVTLFIALMSSTLLAGGRENGGGHWLATEFRERARFISQYLENEIILSQNQIQQLIASIAETRIEMTNDELSDEFGADAKAQTTDDPQRPGKKLIRVKEKEWQALLSGESPGNPVAIVFHEYLRSIGIPDYNEFTSSQLKVNEDDYVAWIKEHRRSEDNVIVLPVAVRGDLVMFSPSETDLQNKTRALVSYADKARLWRGSIEEAIRNEIGDTIGVRGVLIEKSAGIQDSDIASIQTSRLITLARTYHYSREYPRSARSELHVQYWKSEILSSRYSSKRIRLGHQGQFTERVRIYLEKDRTLLKAQDIPLESPLQYWKSSYGTEEEGRDHFKITYERILHDYRKVCEEWKVSMREKFRDIWDIVLLDCGIPEMVQDESQLGADDIVEVRSGTIGSSVYQHYFRLQGYKLVSRASIYYLQK